MNKILSYIPTWETFLLYIGGIPTIISSAILGIVVFITARNKAFSLSELNHLKHSGRRMLKEEQALRTKVLSAPKGIQFLYRHWIGEINYHDLINGG